ncbi:MAG: DUF3301 domain-containing protein [Methylococcales bacterium]|nr:DUF3301 domain-containing protein [Methylococcales bacterium]
MINFFLIGLLLFGFYFFSNALKARETALNAAKRHCQKLELQMLDECVALTAFWIKRNKKGQFEGWRSYSFEFSSTGLERYQGKLTLLGSTIIAIELEPYREG